MPKRICSLWNMKIQVWTTLKIKKKAFPLGVNIHHFEENFHQKIISFFLEYRIKGSNHKEQKQNINILALRDEKKRIAKNKVNDAE